MEFNQVVKKRAMIREYQDRDVPEEKIKKILDNAYRSPSAGHTQPQEYIVARDKGQREKLSDAAWGQDQIAQAPVVIAVVSDTSRSAARYGERGINFYSIVDGSFSSMIILLSAVAEGLGASFVGAFNDREVSKVLGLPSHVRPIGLIAIGYGAEPPPRYPRLPKEKIIHYEKW